jgi:hypothetical protein
MEGRVDFRLLSPCASGLRTLRQLVRTSLCPLHQRQPRGPTLSIRRLPVPPPGSTGVASTNLVDHRLEEPPHKPHFSGVFSLAAYTRRVKPSSGRKLAANSARPRGIRNACGKNIARTNTMIAAIKKSVLISSPPHIYVREAKQFLYYHLTGRI